MRPLTIDEVSCISGGGGNAGVQGAANSLGTAVAAFVAATVTTSVIGGVTALAVIGINSVAQAANPNINGDPQKDSNTSMPSVDPMGNPTGVNLSMNETGDFSSGSDGGYGGDGGGGYFAS